MSENRKTLPLHEAVKLSLSSVGMRSRGIEHNLFYIIDSPGSGKTRTIESEVAKAGFGFCPYSPALERIEKFGGIPDMYWTDGEQKQLRTIWSVPQMITEINDAATKYPYVVVLFDDWHLCDEDLQRIGFEVFTYYKMNNNPIANNVIFILAGNESSAAGAKIQLSAIRNRSTVLYTYADVKNWINNYAIPNDIHPAGISFFSNPMNQDIFQEKESTVEQFGSPRSWTSLFNTIKFIEENKVLHEEDEDNNLVVPSKYIHAVAQGCVSRTAAERFMLHYEIFKNVDVNKLLDKGIVQIPGESVNRYCYAIAITYEFYSRYCGDYSDSNKDKFGNAFVAMLGELKNVAPELVPCSLITIGNIPDSLNGMSGMSVLADLYRKEILPAKMIADLKTITKILHS